MSTRRRILFIHQNFPGQFGHLSRHLAELGHEVVALGVQPRAVPGVRVLRHAPKAPPQPSHVTPVRDFEVKVVRGLSAAGALQALRAEGFVPDTIVAHPGWGEALFCRDIFPESRLLMFAEFFYSAEGADFGFDPEFGRPGLPARVALRLKNTALMHALLAADGGYVPTVWQQRQIPEPFRDRYEVIFDGIDTTLVAPDPRASVQLQRDGLRLAAGDEILTFVNRNLEPYRGFHIFMRALPDILAARPGARVLIVGRDDVSYGSKPAGGGTWREVMLREVGDRLPMDRVHFLGPLPYADYLRVLQISACHVYLTYPFVLSWSCVEAMSAGCTLVASATPPVREFIDDGVHGRLFDFFDTRALTDTVVDVLARPAEHRALGQAARARVVESYDLRRVCLPRQRALVLGG